MICLCVNLFHVSKTRNILLTFSFGIKNDRTNDLYFFLFSELAQKVQAERAEKQALHEAGVKKKKEIIAKSAADKAERQVNRYFAYNNDKSFVLCSDASQSTSTRIKTS